MPLLFITFINSGIKIQKSESGMIKVLFPYNSIFVEKIKTIQDHRQHPQEKYWGFPNSDGTLEKILKVFEGEKISIDSFLILKLSLKQPHHNFKNLRRKPIFFIIETYLNFIAKNPLT